MEPVRVMFNIGFGEFAIIFIVLIIAVGPERLPTMMKTIGKTMRTLRQASRDLRASTGIDELMREDFDLYTPPPRRPAPPPGPALVGRSESPALTADDATAAVTATVLEPSAVADGGEPERAANAESSDPALLSDGPLSSQAPASLPEPVHAKLDDSLPSDAPAAPPELERGAAGAPAAEPVAERPREASKPRES